VQGVDHRLPRGYLVGTDNIKAICPQALDDGGCDALVGEQAQPSLRRKHGFTGQMIGSEDLRCPNIFDCEVGVVRQQLIDAVARRKATQDMLDCDARTADHRLAHHYLGVALDAWMIHGAILRHSNGRRKGWPT
jgi:hypothetical protein